MSNCSPPKQKDLSTDDLNKGTAIALQAMGIQSCKTTTAAAGGFTLIPPAAIAGGVTTSVGCEQVSAMAAAIAATQNVITCTLNTTTVENTTLITQDNFIEISYEGNVPLNLQISQINAVNIKCVSSLDAEQKVAITTALSSSMQTFFDNAQNSKTGWLSTTQGAKSIQTLKQNLTQNVINTVANEVVDSQAFSVQQNNKISLKLSTYDPITNSASSSVVNLSQQNMIEYQAYQLVSTFYNQIFSSTEAGDFKDNFKNEATNQSEGAESIVGPLLSAGLFVFLLIGGGLVLFGGSSIQSVAKYILPLGLMAAAVGSIVFGLKKKTAIAVALGIIAVLFGALEAYSLKQPPSTIVRKRKGNKRK